MADSWRYGDDRLLAARTSLEAHAACALRLMTSTTCPGAPHQTANAAAGEATFDFSRMVVELLTPEGMRKDHTHCAPSGYYFMPVNTAGPYRLRVRTDT